MPINDPPPVPFNGQYGYMFTHWPTWTTETVPDDRPALRRWLDRMRKQVRR